ncbi:MAG: SdpI family protein [Acutalibacteraceae bacterium]|nr:SdpI family protein [Acutalibacteraceae bacterium]
MTFWLGITLTVILIPALMIICGKYYIKKAPKNINHFVGYRTTRSMKNNETWQFAHNYMGKLWFKYGVVLLIVTVILMFLPIGQDEDAVGGLAAIITTVQVFVMIVPCVLTEKALKENFDEDGNRKNINPEE